MTGLIEDDAIIGDTETVALVDRSGSIDWWCAPRIDSGVCFAAVLGDPSHGRWLLAPRRRGPGHEPLAPRPHAGQKPGPRDPRPVPVPVPVNR